MKAATAASGWESVRGAFRSALAPWVVLLIGVPVSLFLFFLIRDSVENLARLQFEREAKDATGVIENRLRSYSDVLYSLRALFASEQPVDRLRFHRFVKSLDLRDRYPGFISLNYAAYVSPKDKTRFEAEVRRDTSLDPQGYPHFSVKPPGERSEYYVIVYLEPMTDYEFALGLDLGSNPMAQAPEKVANALRSGRDSGKLLSSAQPLRVKRAKEVIYLAMRLAVYRTGMPVDTTEQRREAYLGSVGAGFDVEDLMKAALSGDILKYMRLKLYDVGAVDRANFGSSTTKRLLFDSGQSGNGSNIEAAIGAADEDALVHVLPVEIANRIWQLQYIAPRRAMVGQLDKLWAPGVLLAGLLLTVLLSGGLYSLSSSRNRALALAAQMTKDLRETEERFRLITENASDLITVHDPQGRRLYVNPAFGKLFGNPETLIGTDAFNDVHPLDRAQVRKTFFETVEDGRNRSVEFRLLLASGEVRHIESHRSAVLDQQRRVALVVSVARDVTERRRTEEDLHDYAERLRVTSRRLVEVQESERRLIASELHDRVGQNLTGLGLNLSIVASGLQASDRPELAARLEDSNALLRDTVDAIRNVMAELRPHTLDEYGLPAALRSLAAGFSQRTGIQVSFEGGPARTEFPKTVDLAMFRIVQEALNNIAKHSSADCVEIAISRRNGHATLSVRDNGVGFDPTKVESSDGSGWGLRIMRERAESVGARFSLKAKPNRGVDVLVEYHTETGA